MAFFVRSYVKIEERKQRNSMQQNFMKTRPVLPLVLSMSLPMVLSMLVSSLYNIVDSYYVAQISESAMTALSLVYPVQNLINAVAIGFSVGANAVISFYLGAQDSRKVTAAASQSILWNGLHGLVLTAVCIPVMPAFLGMFTTDEVVIDLGVRYSRIAFAFSVVIAAAMSMEKICQATGKMMMTMVCMLSGCVTNIVLDPVLIFGWGPIPAMGIEGAAIATGVGQAFSLVVYLMLYAAGKIPVRLRFDREIADPAIARKMYDVGVPATLNLALPSVLISCLNIILAAYGELYVLVLGVYYKLQTFLYLPASGIVQGMRPIVGYNYGAREYGRVRKIFFTGLGLSAGIMAVGTVLCWAVPGQLVGMFSANAQTIQAGSAALRIISLGFIISAVSVIACGVLEGLGMGFPSLVISLLRYVLCIIPAAFVLSRLWGVNGVWHAFWATEVLATLVSWQICCRKVFVRRRQAQ